MKVKIFWKKNCPNCPKAKRLGEQLEEENILVQYFDVDTVDGLAEACLYDILSTPSFVITDSGDNEIIAWKGQVPFLEEILKEVTSPR
ncbi:MAG TPA: hypothetical protein DEG96_04365 [Candidatus Atribacteria bacterium]|nr:hypothetical protein [Candidatus Atribacteria bacterium]